MDDENNYLDEYLTLKQLNLKTKKYSLIIKRDIIILLSDDNNIN